MCLPLEGRCPILPTSETRHRCWLHAIDAKKLLIGVARICDAGHIVAFALERGTGRHIGIGQAAKFHRVGNMCRPIVNLCWGDAGVFGQGR